MKLTHRRLLGVALAVILLLSPMAVPSAGEVLAASGPVWTEYPGEVSLEDEPNVVDTCVIKDGGTYKMWYTHIKTDTDIISVLGNASAVLNSTNIINDISNLNLVQLLNDLHSVNISSLKNVFNGTAAVVGYAESVDGVNWEVQNSTVFSGGSAIWNSTLTPKVIKDGGVFRMWYTHLKTSLTQAELSTILTKLGTSEQRYNALTELLSSMSTVIGYAISGDGVSWEVINPEILAGSNGVWDSVTAPNVIKVGSLYRMFYTRMNSNVNETDLRAIDSPTFNVDSLLNIADKMSTVIGYADSTDLNSTWTPRLKNGTATTVSNSEVLSGGSGIWNSVSNANVIQNGTTYEMWYTRGRTNLTSTTARQLVNETAKLVIPVWNILDDWITDNLTKFNEDVNNLNLTAIKGLLNGTSSVVAYATSGDGLNWIVQDPLNLVGKSSAIWNSVSAASVVNEGTGCSMWYQKGIDDLNMDNVLGLLAGTKLPIGYAFFGISGPSMTVITEPATDKTSTSATLNGNLTGMGTASPVAVYFQWSVNSTFIDTTSASVRVNAPASVLPDTNFTAGIDIFNVTELNAVNYDVSFDPDVLRLDAVTNGTINGTNVPVDVWNLYENGTATVVEHQPGLSNVTGSGTLAVLHFHSVGPNGSSSVITLSNGSLYNSADNEITAAWVGQKVAIPDVQYLYNPDEFSSNVAGLMMNTTYIYRAVASGNGTTVYGNYVTFMTLALPPEAVLRITVNLQNRKQPEDPLLPNPMVIPVEVWLHEPGEPWNDTLTNYGALYYYNTNTSFTGSYDTALIELNVPPGMYDIRVKGFNTLKNLLSGVVVSAPGPVDIDMGILIAGDANGSNSVDILDCSLVLKYFGYDPNAEDAPLGARLCDFNKSGSVDILDCSILLKNFGRTGADVGGD